MSERGEPPSRSKPKSALRLHRFDERLRAERGVSALIGVDEAGRGPLAGPVVTAAVLLPSGILAPLAGVRDSKLLTPDKRAFFYDRIRARALAVSVAWAHPREIDRINILAATLAAMRRAVSRIEAEALVLVDGNRRIAGLDRPQLTLIGGDDLSLSIACASIVAKVARDRWMGRLENNYPGYGLARHKGYATSLHREALKKLGPSPLHRRSFSPVGDLYEP